MTEKWVSQAKHWCAICKVWMDAKKIVRCSWRDPTHLKFFVARAHCAIIQLDLVIAFLPVSLCRDQSINIHETGRGHKEKLEQHLDEQRHRRSNSSMGSKELDAEMRVIEEVFDIIALGGTKH